MKFLDNLVRASIERIRKEQNALNQEEIADTSYNNRLFPTGRPDRANGITVRPVIDSEMPLRLLVHNALGGKLIEVTVQPRVDDWATKAEALQKVSLYIVHDDADLGEELSKIITTEFLKNG